MRPTRPRVRARPSLLALGGLLAVAACAPPGEATYQGVEPLLVAPSAPNSLSVLGIVRATALGDWNGDGHLDVAAATDSGVQIFTGGTSGPGAVFQSLGGAGVASAVAGADLDGDGRHDLVVGGAAWVAIYLNGTAGLSTTPTYTLSGFGGVG